MKVLFMFLLAVTISAQSIDVLEVIKINKDENAEYAHAKFSPDGEKILYTKFNYKGLFLYEKASQSVSELNDLDGAGYEPVFTEDSKNIIFRNDSFRGLKKYSSIKTQNIEDKKISTLVPEARFLSAPMVSSNNLVYTKENKIEVVKVSENSLNKSAADISVTIENQKLAVIENGFKKILDPVNDGNYIWPSVSPDKKEILFTAAGFGTFICDLEGKLLYEIGYANAPKFSPDGNWIIFMEDKDDHDKIISSDIFAASKNGSVKIKLTDTPEIHEMYPDWSPKGDEIVFNSNDGNIYLMKIKVN